MDFRDKFKGVEKPQLIPELRFTPYTPRESSEKLGIKWQDVVMLYEEGYLSFDPEKTIIESEEQSLEWDFLARLIAGGCQKDQLALLLKDLEPPYAYDIRRIYFDWAFKKWRTIPRLKSLAAFVEDAIDETFDDDDIDTLYELSSSIETAIEVMNNEIALYGRRRDGEEKDPE